MDSDSSLVFLSYSSPDRDRVLAFYEFLVTKGLNVWIDVHRIKPGQDWNLEIQRALNKAALVIVFISNQSVDRRGYAQREIKVVLDKRHEKIAGDIYLVPVLLDSDASIPEQFAEIQCVRADNEACFNQIDDAIRHQLSRLGIASAKIQKSSGVTWHKIPTHEHWDGIPGYELDIQKMRLSSTRYPGLDEINHILEGETAKQLFSARSVKFFQDPELYNFGQEHFRRTNTFQTSFLDPIVVNRSLSIACAHSWYYAGAVHGGQKIETYNFTLDPPAMVGGLSDLFRNPEDALPEVQRLTRQALTQSLTSTEYPSDSEWTERGTSGWNDFSSFVLGPDALELHFQEYQVACYADGPGDYALDIPSVTNDDRTCPEVLSCPRSVSPMRSSRTRTRRALTSRSCAGLTGRFALIAG